MGTTRHTRARAPGGSRFLDPAVLARIDNLELVARTVVDGFVAGLHRSPYLGLSLDFAEHRAYMPGDDTRRIDWRLYARTDRHYVKQFEADTNASFTVLLDVSKSMGYGSDGAGSGPGGPGGLRKIDYARILAACLTYFAHRQRDRVGFAAFADEVRDYVPPSTRHLDVVLHALDRAEPDGGGALEPALRTLAEMPRRRGIIALVSDLYEEPDRVFDAVRHLKGRGNDVIVFHVLDPAELEFPFQESGSFRDLETGEQLPVLPEKVRERYRSLIREHVATLDRRLTDARIDYALLDTGQPLDHALFRYLSTRQRLSRVR